MYPLNPLYEFLEENVKRRLAKNFADTLVAPKSNLAKKLLTSKLAGQTAGKEVRKSLGSNYKPVYQKAKKFSLEYKGVKPNMPSRQNISTTWLKGQQASSDAKDIVRKHIPHTTGDTWKTSKISGRKVFRKLPLPQ